MKKISKFFGLLTLLTLSSLMFGPGKAHAATINVNGSCTINDAIGSVNSTSDVGSCISTGVYGTSDIINLPSGTITLTGGMQTINNPLIISGAGKNSTIINANGNPGFNADNINGNFTFQGFKITGAIGGGVGISNAIEANISDVEAQNCETGIFVSNSLHVTISNVYVHDGISGFGHSGGLSINANAVLDTDVPSIHVYDTKVSNNQTISNLAGLNLKIHDHIAASTSLIVQRTSVTGNHSEVSTGVEISSTPHTETELNIDAVSVANNITQPVTPSSDPNPFAPTYNSGFRLEIAGIKAGQNFTNVTVANNSSINNVDNHVSISGFFIILVNPIHILSMFNTTVVGNSIVQATPSLFGRSPTIWLVGITPNGNQGYTITPAGTAQNSLIANNTYNGQPNSCRADMDGTAAGIPGAFDVTPQNLGNNLSDDSTCTGYTLEPNLYNTIAHQVSDNGGPVETIALLDGSPAIRAGGQVLGISTDARGIARPSTPDVGAYQTVLGTSTTTPSSPATNFAGVAMPNTGLGRTSSANSKSAIIVMVITSITILSTLVLRTTHKRETNV